MTAPTHLKVEHLDHPLGLMMHQPRLSWHLPDGARCQLAYQLRAGEWDSGQVESATSILVPYDGPTLRSGQRIDWTVRVWTDLGQSDWAQPAWWEMGLLSIDDWEAQWIEPPHTTREPSTPRHPAWYLHTTCTLPHNIQRARLYATAHGIYELAINGKRVGNAELTPGFTNIVDGDSFKPQLKSMANCRSLTSALLVGLAASGGVPLGQLNGLRGRAPPLTSRGGMPR
ncbi:alpha-L-rhamnosidase N-terminal domain-containing protein [Phytoactinopolyspora limicola]|uniref:glycoside hydrolase family 78 protein n=1 Tax=Phytoactinopolyspora limicola TaxID=2715536 RepID=UPI00140B9CAE